MGSQGYWQYNGSGNMWLGTMGLRPSHSLGRRASCACVRLADPLDHAQADHSGMDSWQMVPPYASCRRQLSLHPA
jgi:hypothetical protein